MVEAVARVMEVRAAAREAVAKAAAMAVAMAAAEAVPGKLRLCHRRRLGTLPRSRPCLLLRRRHWAPDSLSSY